MIGAYYLDRTMTNTENCYTTQVLVAHVRPKLPTDFFSE